MDVQIWEKTIVAWVNCFISSTPIKNVNQINESVLTDIIKQVRSDFQKNLVDFFIEIYPNFIDSYPYELSSTVDFFCAATLLLVYVSFSNESEFEGLREVMCTKLDNIAQVNIAEFLMGIQAHGNVFSFSLKLIHQEIYKFVERHATQTSVIGDSIKTPVKNVLNNSFDSPLQGFFQTPKRSQSSRQKCSSSMCGDGDHLKKIKKLTSQLVEEESEKASLQEQLKIQTQKCIEYEMKLRNKIKEVNNLKYEWENDSKKNEVEFKSLKDNFLKKLEDEKKIKSELSHLENYISTLETDLSNSASEKNKVEFQLKETLEKCAANELQLKKITELNLELQQLLENKEKELIQIKVEYGTLYKDEKSIDTSFMEASFDINTSTPENMGVVIEKLLGEKNEENTILNEKVEELKKEKNHLENELQLINEQLALKCFTISELEFLNKELNAKIESFAVTEKELYKVQKELCIANAELNKFMKENSDLNEKLNVLNKSLHDREQTLINCKNSKMLFEINFLKLAEEFRAVQQQLEYEIRNISNLNPNANEIFFKPEKSSASPENIEITEGVFRSKDSLQGESLEKDQQVSRNIEKNYFFTPLNFQTSFGNEKIEKTSELLQNQQFEWAESKASMQKTCKQLSENIVKLKLKVIELEDSCCKSVEEKNELERHLKKTDEKIADIESLHSFEVVKLKGELKTKDERIKELESIITHFKKVQEEFIIQNEALKNGVSNIIKTNNMKFVEEGEEFTSTQKLGFDRLTSDMKVLEPTQEHQELSDSLEEVPVCNKTFDIVNIEEKNISDKTFSVKEDNVYNGKTSNRHSVWVVSPPSKLTSKGKLKQTDSSNEKKHVLGKSWVVPLTPVKPKEKVKKISSSTNDLTSKAESSKNESIPNLTKSSSLSSIMEIDYSPPSKIESRTSTTTSFHSVTDLTELKKKDETVEISQSIRVKDFANAQAFELHIQKCKSSEHSPQKNIKFMERNDPLGGFFSKNSCNSTSNNLVLDRSVTNFQKEIVSLSKECDRLRSALLESEHKRKRDRETFEKNQNIIRQNIALKYEGQLEHLKNEMKQLHNTELAKHKAEQSKLNFELREQNKRYKEHINELRNQLWDLGEKLLQEQKLKRDLERNYADLKKKLESVVFYKYSDTKSPIVDERYKECFHDENILSDLRQIPNRAFPTIPTEDEEEVFDNRFLEDMKTGLCKLEKPEGRLMELQYRNSLCLPHLKSSYPGETQFHNPTLFKENDLKLGLLNFGQESQSLTDSDHSMTKSLIPENKGKKKEQTSYKKPGPPTPSKNGGRLSIQSGDLGLTPRNVLKEINDQQERGKGTPNPLKGLLLSKTAKGGSVGIKNENTAPVTPRKKNKFFRKPFGARDH